MPNERGRTRTPLPRPGAAHPRAPAAGARSRPFRFCSPLTAPSRSSADSPTGLSAHPGPALTRTEGVEHDGNGTPSSGRRPERHRGGKDARSWRESARPASPTRTTSNARTSSATSRRSTAARPPKSSKAERPRSGRRRPHDAEAPHGARQLRDGARLHGRDAVLRAGGRGRGRGLRRLQAVRPRRRRRRPRHALSHEGGRPRGRGARHPPDGEVHPAAPRQAQGVGRHRNVLPPALRRPHHERESRSRSSARRRSPRSAAS